MSDGGYKNHEGKVRLDLLPVEALELVGMVATQGARRVGDRNWEKGMKWSYPYAAILRHLFAYWRGEDIDPKHGLPHLAHAAFWVLALLDYQLKGNGTDDRPPEPNWVKAAPREEIRAMFLRAMNREGA